MDELSPRGRSPVQSLQKKVTAQSCRWKVIRACEAFVSTFRCAAANRTLHPARRLGTACRCDDVVCGPPAQTATDPNYSKKVFFTAASKPSLSHQKKARAVAQVCLWRHYVRNRSGVQWFLSRCSLRRLLFCWQITRWPVEAYFLPAASTLRVGSAPFQVTSAVGP
jgi:hypothetical protein